MPVIEGDYIYSIKVSSHQDDQFSKSLRIVRPGRASHNCSIAVYEGSSMSCKCSSSTKGNPPAEFLWEGVNSDTLHLYNIQRKDNGNKYTCRPTWGHIGLSGRATVYILKVIASVSIVPNSCSVQLSEWKVSGVCTVQWLSTIKNRSCNWSLETKTKAEGLTGVQSIVSFHSMDAVDFVNCSFEQQMPVDDGNYTYSINVSLHPGDQFSTSLYIEKPDEPQHNCPKMVLEGSDITCTCFTLKLGSPPAQIRWAESGKEDFVIEGIKRERNGIVATCTLTWGVINYTIPYKINVASIDINPSAVFRWNILCEKETHNENSSRCTLSTERMIDEMTIQCTASNQIFAEVSLASIYVLTLPHNHFKGGLIAGSVAAVLVLAAVVAVVVVCIKRRKVVNKNKTQTPIVRFAAPSGDVYTIAGTTTVSHGQDEYVTIRDTTCQDHIPETQTPAVRFAAPSGDLYTIAGPVQEATKKRKSATKYVTGPEAKYSARTKNKGLESNKTAIKPKPTILGVKKLQDLSVDNKPQTQTPTVRFAAPSGDLYTIAGPTTAGKDKHVTEAMKNRSYAAKSSSDQTKHIALKTNEVIESKKMAIKPKPKRFSEKKLQDLSVTGYMDVTEVPTDSGTGVYPVVPWVAETGCSDARVLDTSVFSEDEYNVLRFQENRTGQDDHAVTYSHLAFK